MKRTRGRLPEEEEDGADERFVPLVFPPTKPSRNTSSMEEDAASIAGEAKETQDDSDSNGFRPSVRPRKRQRMEVIDEDAASPTRLPSSSSFGTPAHYHPRPTDDERLLKSVKKLRLESLNDEYRDINQLLSALTAERMQRRKQQQQQLEGQGKPPSR